jgi:Uncharacterised nucleotidyltransferase
VLLLSAGLADPETARAAWERWRVSNTLEEADTASARFLPLVYRNLAARGLSGPDIGKLKGIYRAGWLHNQLLMQRAVSALGILADAGVPTLVLKGLALGLVHYRDPGARPMDDVDLLVPAADADRAIEAMRHAGWVTDPDGSCTRRRSAHAQHLYDATGRMIDLHWYSLAQSASDDGFWARSVELDVMGAPTRALSPVDQLLQVAAHGGQWSAVPQIRWMADAVKIQRTAGVELDWDTFTAEAIARRLTVALHAALEQLAEAVDFDVPELVLGRLRATGSTRFERRIHELTMHPTGGGRWVLVEFERFRRRARLDPTLRTSDFLKDHFGVSRRRELVRPVVRKALEVTGSRIRGRRRGEAC